MVTFHNEQPREGQSSYHLVNHAAEAAIIWPAAPLLLVGTPGHEQCWASGG